MNAKEIKQMANQIADVWIAEAEQNDEDIIEIFSKLGSSIHKGE